MTFEENPFRVLQVSLYATKATIIERADDLSFADPDREKIFAQARDTLLNPRKRIAAEFREIIGDKILHDVSGLNKIIAVDKKYSALDAEDIREQINAARKISKFPVVQDTAAIKDELKNLRANIREEIQAELKFMRIRMRVNFVNNIAYEISRQKTFGVVMEDFFDSYRLEMNPFFDETREKILSLLPKIKINADKKFLDELAAQVTAFAEARRPLDKFSMTLGTNDFKATEKIFRAVRATAIDLFNEKFART